jgi:hypothetical protein
MIHPGWRFFFQSTKIQENIIENFTTRFVYAVVKAPNDIEGRL